MKHQKAGRIMAGGIFFLANSLLAGCDEAPTPSGPQQYEEGENVMARKDAGVMTELQEVSPGQYRIIKEYPSSRTGVVVNKLDGTREDMPYDKVQSSMENAGREGGFGVGTVLASGLLGYMMGKTTSLNPYVYRDNNLYSQSLANRDVLTERIREEERRNSQWNARSYWYGRSGFSRPMSGTSVSRSSPQAGRTGFFSRMMSSIRGFSG
jgi:hypothetical protein